MLKNMSIDKPDIIQTIQREGIELKKYGSRYKANCPLHHEKTPSFTVYPDSQSFYCFGCGEGGDVIDFIIKLKGIAFKEALAYLGMKSGKGYKPTKRDNKMLLKRRLVSAFREWEKRYYDKLAFIYRTFNSIKAKFKTMEEAEEFADVYHIISICEYRMDILFYGDDEAKYELFLEVEYGQI
jgi:DNA primase